MAFDDDDDVSKRHATPSAEDADAAAEEDLEDEAQDFRHFAALQRKNISVQAIRKGEKDFESHGTRSQASALEQSRRAMEDVLGYTRIHQKKAWVRGWYFPDRWASAGMEDEEYRRDDEKAAKIAAERSAERREIHARDRVVCVGVEHKTLGRKIRGQTTQQPGWDQVWLLPEEALFLLERGTMDLWWPTASMAEVLPVDPQDHGGGNRGKTTESTEAPTEGEDEEDDDYAFGFPLSLQAAYSLLVGSEGERGKVTLRNFQVYSNLNRAGFNVLRVAPPESIPETPVEVIGSQQPLWQRLISLLFSERHHIPPAYGPVVRPGLYRSYESIYKQLALIPRHRPTDHPPTHPSHAARSPFRVQYHVWKPSVTSWSKTRPPSAPDYHLAIVDAHETSVPTSEELSVLLNSVPYAPPPAMTRSHVVHQRLKHGWRNVLVAVVDHGVINYMRFAEGAFGQEFLYKKFDLRSGPKGAKHSGGRGGRGGGRGRGGGGGRGRGK